MGCQRESGRMKCLAAEGDLADRIRRYQPTVSIMRSIGSNIEHAFRNAAANPSKGCYTCRSPAVAGEPGSRKNWLAISQA